MGTNYRHRKVSLTLLVLLGLAWVAAPWWAPRTVQPAAISVIVIVGVLLVLFSSLTIVMRDEAVDVYFGPGLIRRRIPLRRIRGVRVAQTPWYYGWGIRLTPHGWLWNVQERGGVEIQLEDGHRFRIDSDEPDKIAAAILEAKRAVQPAAAANEQRYDR